MGEIKRDWGFLKNFNSKELVILEGVGQG